MKTIALHTWQDVRNEIKHRIQKGYWQAGELISKETDLATEFSCARATVNRALRELADDGLLERRRKGGTRVVTHPVRKAKLDIPIIRQQIEQRDAIHSHSILEQKKTLPPTTILTQLKLSDKADMLHLRTLHYANDKPFVYEDRWVNLAIVPDILETDLTVISANEWLLKHVPLTTGDISFSAVNANTKQAQLLDIEEDKAIFSMERTTWIDNQAITHVQLFYTPDFRISTTL